MKNKECRWYEKGECLLNGGKCDYTPECDDAEDLDDCDPFREIEEW